MARWFQPTPHTLTHLESARCESHGLPPTADLIRVGSRRWFLQSEPPVWPDFRWPTCCDSVGPRGAVPNGRRKKPVILFWLSGGPSYIDTGDRKPHMCRRRFADPTESIDHALAGDPGLRAFAVAGENHGPAVDHPLGRLLCEQSHANHDAGRQCDGPRTDDGNDGAGYPSMGSIATKFCGPNVAGMPAFRGFGRFLGLRRVGAGAMGNPFDPLKGVELAVWPCPPRSTLHRLQNRHELRQAIRSLSSRIRARLRCRGVTATLRWPTTWSFPAGCRRRLTFPKSRMRIRDAYGRVSIGEKALLARRLVEAGVTFVLVSGAGATSTIMERKSAGGNRARG